MPIKSAKNSVEQIIIITGNLGEGNRPIFLMAAYEGVTKKERSLHVYLLSP